MADDETEIEQVSRGIMPRARAANKLAYLPNLKKDATTAYRIGDAEAVPILTWAGIFDVISIAPLGNVIIAPIAMVVFWFMFELNRVPVIGQKTWIWYLVTWIIELIPFLSIFPTYTLMAFRIITISRVEDKAKSVGINTESNKVKAIARAMLLKNKALIGKQRGRAVARRGEEQGGKIDDARSNLNSALSGKKDANSGVKAEKPQQYNLLTGKEVNRQPLFRRKENAPEQKGTTPAGDNPSSDEKAA